MAKQKLRHCYVLSQGSYSDYRVICVVDGTKKDAEALAARMNPDPGEDSYSNPIEVEEMAVLGPDAQPVEVLKLSVTIWDNGKTEGPEPYKKTIWPGTDWEGTYSVYWRWVRASIHKDRGGRLEVSGTDHERVRKVFSDRIALIISGDPLRDKGNAEGRR
jgi:hypothetical protein